MRDSHENWHFGDLELPVFSLNTLVIGSGAAARNAALQLIRAGQNDVAIATERWNAGTSYNAGSDKQTYYKLSVAGPAPDSPHVLAEDLFSGGCMHGDIALCEASHSAQAFFNLVELGVPFPHDTHGGFLGYRTDHDTRGRATSAGPLTSKLMCERLGEALDREELRVFDECQVVALLTRPDGGKRRAVCGAVALDKTRLDEDNFGLVVFNAENVVLATGGPGGMYRSSVYPQSQLGGIGAALTAGALAHNLTESQFGIASAKFRWNLSGSYQQVIPRYVSTDAGGSDEREFLNDFFPDLTSLTTAIFRKGYEWPFDSGRVVGLGSSLIDVLVFRETVRLGRRVFLDFLKNPTDPTGRETFEVDGLPQEPREYLRNSDATQATPIERLLAMNSPAVDLYRDHGIELERERLEIAVCAQHNNGGLAANVWWESNVTHLFPIGEACGTHGVRRPGGSALNAGQVGALRAALYVAHNYGGEPADLGRFVPAVADQVRECIDFCSRTVDLGNNADDKLLPKDILAEVQDRMSAFAAQIRDPESVAAATRDAWHLERSIRDRLRVNGPQSLPMAFRAADLCLTHAVYLEAINAYLAAGGGSRGGVLVLDAGGESCGAGLDDSWNFRVEAPSSETAQKILEVSLDRLGQVKTAWVSVRPIPDSTGWFEQVWADFRAGSVFSSSEEQSSG